jgi:hypothetical protein
VNPDHLFLGTHKDNHDDKAKKDRGTRKYSKAMIRRVKKKISDGVPQRQIAREENTSPSWVYHVTHRGLHKHV